jgi:hypothetical protein
MSVTPLHPAKPATTSVGQDAVAIFPPPQTGEGPRRKLPKDPTGALRVRRHRQKRKLNPAVTSAVTSQKGNKINANVTIAAIEKRHFHYAPDAAAYIAAIALAGAAAWFSIRGMVVLFPGAPLSVITMACAMETAKLVTAGWLARRWRDTARIWRNVLVALVAGLAVINATGVYAQLVAAHVAERGAMASAIETQDATLAARIEVAAHVVDDLDRRLGQIDTAIETAAKRGKTNTALAAMEGQRKARTGLADARNEAATTLASLKAERAAVVARGRKAETEAAPIRYVAELIGAETDSERAIRWLIALMVLCCDPLAIALTAAASARRSTAA